MVDSKAVIQYLEKEGPCDGDHQKSKGEYTESITLHYT